MRAHRTFFSNKKKLSLFWHHFHLFSLIHTQAGKTFDRNAHKCLLCSCNNFETFCHASQCSHASEMVVYGLFIIVIVVNVYLCGCRHCHRLPLFCLSSEQRTALSSSCLCSNKGKQKLSRKKNTFTLHESGKKVVFVGFQIRPSTMQNRYEKSKSLKIATIIWRISLCIYVSWRKQQQRKNTHIF